MFIRQYDGKVFYDILQLPISNPRRPSCKMKTVYLFKVPIMYVTHKML